MAPAWSSRASCDPTPCRAHRPPWLTSWDCATWPSRSTTCRRLSIGQLPRATDWSVASASTRALGGWPTSGDRKGSSSRWPSASAEPRNARICRDEVAVRHLSLSTCDQVTFCVGVTLLRGPFALVTLPLVEPSGRYFPGEQRAVVRAAEPCSRGRDRRHQVLPLVRHQLRRSAPLCGGVRRPPSSPPSPPTT